MTAILTGQALLSMCLPRTQAAIVLRANYQVPAMAPCLVCASVFVEVYRVETSPRTVHMYVFELYYLFANAQQHAPYVTLYAAYVTLCNVMHRYQNS